MIKILRLFLYLTLQLFVVLTLTGCKKDPFVAPAVEAKTPGTSTTNLTPTATPIIISDVYSQLDTDSASQTLFLYNQNANPTYTKHLYQGIPTIGYNKGYYYAAWISGGTGENLGNYIVVATSADGIVWKELQAVLTSNDPTHRHLDPLFWLDPGNDLHLSWNGSVGMWDGGNLGTWDVKIKMGSQSVLMTKPQFLFHGCFNTKPFPLKPDSTKMVMAVSGWDVTNPWNGNKIIPTPADIMGPYMYKAAYNKITKKLSDPQKLTKISTVGIYRNFDEHMFVDLGDNLFSAILRTTAGIYSSSSTDGGTTWTDPKKFTTFGPTTPTKSFYARLRSGNLLFILNNATTRTNLTAYLSKDNGKTWPYKLLIDAHDEVSYPDMIQNDQNELVIIYDHERHGAQELEVVRITENDIVNNNGGKPVVPVIISHK